jgi:hypothetical protein
MKNEKLRLTLLRDNDVVRGPMVGLDLKIDGRQIAVKFYKSGTGYVAAPGYDIEAVDGNTGTRVPVAIIQTEREAVSVDAVPMSGWEFSIE